jgi:hypothetical protein
MAENSIFLGYCIHFHVTSIPAKKYGRVGRLIRKAIQTELHPGSMNREKKSLPEQVLETSHLSPEGTKAGSLKGQASYFLSI